MGKIVLFWIVFLIVDLLLLAATVFIVATIVKAVFHL